MKRREKFPVIRERLFSHESILTFRDDCSKPVFAPGPSPYARSWSEDAADYSPSARTAAPLMATDCVLATNATTEAISSGVSKRLRSETGPHSGEELLFNFGYRNVLLFGHIFQEAADAFGGGGTGQNGIDGYAGAGNGFG